MILWRISNHQTLDGGGGLRVSGRWHTRGRRIVYCAPNPATALLEVLVHLEIDIEDLPVSLRFLEIEAPDGMALERIGEEELPAGWASRQEVTRELGDRWLERAESVLLLAPSAVVPATENVLINPAHADAGSIRVARTLEHRLDERLAR